MAKPQAEKVEPVSFVAPASWVERVEEWRSRQRPLPSRSEAIRRLVDLALSRELPPSPAPATAPPGTGR